MSTTRINGKKIKFTSKNGQLEVIDTEDGHALSLEEVQELNNYLGKKIATRFVVQTALLVAIPIGFWIYDLTQGKKTNK